jgi:hypothetical protein
MGCAHNRLTVIGSQRVIRSFEKTNWLRQLSGRHQEIYEQGARRAVWWFESDQTLRRLPRLSSKWPGLVFLLDYEDEKKRVKGLVKVLFGKMDHCEISY